MKIKEYFNNLERYWSASFLALLSSVFCLSFITWAGINLVSFIFRAANLSEYFELVCDSFSWGMVYPTIFFPASCFLSACIAIFYIFIIISRKRWSIFVSAFIILIFGGIFFSQILEVVNTPYRSGLFILFYFLPMSIMGVLISCGIYLILLLLELIPKFRVPKSLVSQNSIFKKFIKIFYWLYFLLICDIFYILIYVIIYPAAHY